MLCPEQLDGRSRRCIYKGCANCGIATLDKDFFDPLGSLADAKVTYRPVEKDGAGRLGVQVKSDRPPAEFINHVKSKLIGFPKHRFLAHNQDAEFEKLLQNLDLKHLVILSDFAEKFTPKEFEEIHSKWPK